MNKTYKRGRTGDPIHEAFNVSHVLGAAYEVREGKTIFNESKWKRISTWPKYGSLPVLDVLAGIELILSEQQKVLKQFYEKMGVIDDYFYYGGVTYEIFFESIPIKEGAFRLFEEGGKLKVCRIEEVGITFCKVVFGSKEAVKVKKSQLSFEVLPI